MSHIFVDELPGDPETKNFRRQVSSLVGSCSTAPLLGVLLCAFVGGHVAGHA